MAPPASKVAVPSVAPVPPAAAVTAAPTVVAPGVSTGQRPAGAVPSDALFAAGCSVLFRQPKAVGTAQAASRRWQDGVVVSVRSLEESPTSPTDGMTRRMVTVREADSGAVCGELVAGVDVHLFSPPPSSAAITDLMMIPYTHEAAVLRILGERLQLHLQPYTSVGDNTLIALNPYRVLDGPASATQPSVGPGWIAQQALQFCLSNAGGGGEIGDASSSASGDIGDSLLPSSLHAVVVMTGQSGSGKTEATKRVMRALGRAHGGHQGGGAVPPPPPNTATNVGKAMIAGAAVESGADVAARLLSQAHPILEMFGNAATTMNANSSRFAKLVSLDVAAEGGHIEAVTISTYLLEVSRVVCPGPGESNFHIFHALFEGGSEWATDRRGAVGGTAATGLSAVERAELELWDPSLFAAVCTQWDTASIAPPRAAYGAPIAATPPFTLQEVRVAMSTACGMTPTEIRAVWRCLAAILHLLNVEFAAVDASGRPDPHAPAAIRNMAPLVKAASLLAVNSQQLSDALISQLIDVAGQPPQLRRFNVSRAHATRHTLAKALYDGCFAFLIARLNEKGRQIQAPLRRPDGTVDDATASSGARAPPHNKKGKPSEAPSEGVHEGQGRALRHHRVTLLDIFGFETVPPPAVNGLEQLLINYTNEELQRLVNEDTVVNFIEEAAREHVPQAIPAGFSSSQDASRDASMAAPSTAGLEALTGAVIGRTSAAGPSTAAGSSKRPCVLGVISDESVLGAAQTTPVNLCDKILALCNATSTSSGYEGIRKPKVQASVQHPTFVIRHYAGDVGYSTAEMANRNRVVPDILKSFRSLSTDSDTRAVLGGSALPTPADGDTTAGRSKPASGGVLSLVNKFKSQLDDLLSLLRGKAAVPSSISSATTSLHSFSKTKLFWIRCIKPNLNCLPVLADEEVVAEQLRQCGIVRTLTLLASGHSVRLPHRHIACWGGAILPTFPTKQFAQCDWKEVCRLVGAQIARWMLGNTATPSSSAAVPPLLVGVRQCFLRPAAFVFLCDRVASVHRGNAGKFQCHGRAYLARRLLAAAHVAAQRHQMQQRREARLIAERPLREALEMRRRRAEQTAARWRQQRLTQNATRVAHLNGKGCLANVVDTIAQMEKELLRATAEIRQVDVLRIEKERMFETQEAFAKEYERKLASERDRLQQRAAALERTQARARDERTHRGDLGFASAQARQHREAELLALITGARRQVLQSEKERDLERLERAAQQRAAGKQLWVENHLARVEKRMALRSTVAQFQQERDWVAAATIAAAVAPARSTGTGDDVVRSSSSATRLRRPASEPTSSRTPRWEASDYGDD